jgi:hypothetical protein
MAGKSSFLSTFNLDVLINDPLQYSKCCEHRLLSSLPYIKLVTKTSFQLFMLLYFIPQTINGIFWAYSLQSKFLTISQTAKVSIDRIDEFLREVCFILLKASDYRATDKIPSSSGGMIVA